MSKVNSIITLFAILIVWLSSCNPQDEPLQIASNFPLREVSRLSTDEVIERIAVSENWIAIQSANKITSIDAVSKEILWEVPFESWYVTDSRFQIMNETLIAASKSQVVLIDRDGRITNLNIDSPKEGSIWRLVAAYPDYVYIIRGPDWTLEAYDIRANTLLWKTRVGRGGTDVFYEPADDNVYVTARDYPVRAFDNTTGTQLWKQDTSVLHSTFEASVLYLCEPTDKAQEFLLSALDTKSQETLWTAVVDEVDSVYRLTILNDTLAVSTSDGVIAVDKSTGNGLWKALENESFVASPVQSNGFIFIKGTSHTVYALSPDTGDLVGYLTLENKNSLVQPAYEAEGEVHLLDDGIVFNTRNFLVVYKPE